MQEIRIDPASCGGRLDKLLIKYLDKAPSGFIYKMLRKKNITLNSKKAFGNEILSEGDSIKLFLADETIAKFKSSEIYTRQTQGSLKLASMIIYEDEQIIAVNKPAGLLSQKSSPSDRCINDMLIDYLGKTDLFTPGISNRLDRNTSGIILAGKNPRSVRTVNEAVKNRDVQKLYLTVVYGIMASDLMLEGYIVKDRSRNISHVQSIEEYSEDPAENASRIKTGVHILCAGNQCTLAQIDLITGRSHQIRAQMAFQGYPILGDRKYSSGNYYADINRKYALKYQMLHAREIRFQNMHDTLSYLNGKVIKAPLPEVFTRVLKGEGLCLPGDQED